MARVLIAEARFYAHLNDMNPLPLVAVAGNPNAGKSALFNALTGARQKVGNYPGVTVERHVGRATLPDGAPVEFVDLPGAYGLDPSSPDEAVTRDVLLGKQKGERLPQALLIVVDASNLDNHLRFALQLIDLGLPTVIALNMIDLAKRDGLELDAGKLEQELGVPVVETVAVRKRGMDEVMERLNELLLQPRKIRAGEGPSHDLLTLQRRAREIAIGAIVRETPVRRITHRLDGVLLHPVAGPIILAAVMFLMFQAVFSWSTVPADALEAATLNIGNVVGRALPPGLFRSMIVDGVFAGVGAVIVFLPQILILFGFILVLESTGYMVRAAFIMLKENGITTSRVAARIANLQAQLLDGLSAAPLGEAELLNPLDGGSHADRSEPGRLAVRYCTGNSGFCRNLCR